jgi:hypothetical protein
MSTSPLETVVPSRTHAHTRTIQARPNVQGQGRGTPPLLPLSQPLISTTTTTARVPWDTTAPGGGSGTTRAPWAAAMPMMTSAGSSGSGSGSMGPPRLTGMNIGGRGRRGAGDHDVGGGLG